MKGAIPGAHNLCHYYSPGQDLNPDPLQADFPHETLSSCLPRDDGVDGRLVVNIHICGSIASNLIGPV